jgi:hypothetical protein
LFDSLCWPVNVPYGSLIGMGNLTLDAALDGFLDPFSCWLDAAHGKSARLALLALVAYACWLHPTSLAAAPTITYVQGNYATPQTPETSVEVTFTAAQSAGNLNVVVVGWNNSTATVSAVTDSRGNTYIRAVGPTVQSGIASQSIYYAKNVAAAAAGANRVTVTFTSAAAYPDIRILEYTGADPGNPVDVTAANSGNSATSSSGPATTTHASDLILGANLVQTVTTGPGSGFTERLLTTPDGDIAEDRMVTATGSYSATAPVNPSGPWIMQMVAFRTPSTLPTVSSVSPSGGPTGGGTAVTITGTNFAAGAAVTFGAKAATNVVVVSATRITAKTPAGSLGAVTVTVTVKGKSGSLTHGFSYLLPPTVSRVSPDSGSTAGGTAVTITGTNFAAGATVTFGGTAATRVVVEKTTTLTATTPARSAGAVTVTVSVGGQSGSLTRGFTYIVVPAVSSVSPKSGSTAGGTAVTITGTDFVAGATVTFGGKAATDVVVVSGTEITAKTPAGSAGAVTVTVANPGGRSGSLANGFTYVAVLPVKASSNGRYLVDQNNSPWVLMADSPQGMICTIDAADMATYMSARQAQGFNAINPDAICTTYTGGNSSGTAFDGTPPFTSGSSPSNYDLSTPNSSYFTELDSLINLASSYGLVVILDPIETGGWLTTLENNGPTKAYNYGAYLGNRYKNFKNIIWLSGNDFQTWNTSSTDNNLVYQVMRGIASADPNHLQSIELNYQFSYSNQDTTLAKVLTADGAYTYLETYDCVLQAYASSPTIPAYLVEANYEGENNTGALPGPAGTYVLREQAYWTLTSGGVGQIWGNHYFWGFFSGWQEQLDSPGALEIKHINQLFGSVTWWDLVPDTTHEVVTAGYGTYDGSNANFTTATYCTTSWISSGSLAGSLALTYCPKASTLTVDLAKFSGPATAQWYDPSHGTYNAISGSPFPNSGTQDFTTPGDNLDGNPDWVLVMTAPPGS